MQTCDKNRFQGRPDWHKKVNNPHCVLIKDPSDQPVEIVEEREQIEAQLAPGLLLAVIKNVGVHHTDGVVHDLRAIGWPVEKPERGREAEFSRATEAAAGICCCCCRTSTDGRRATGC